MVCAFECGCMCLKVQTFGKPFKHRNLDLKVKSHLICFSEALFTHF